jgi:hypothetical protein
VVATGCVGCAVCADASVAQTKMARDRFFTRVLSLGGDFCGLLLK